MKILNSMILKEKSGIISYTLTADLKRLASYMTENNVSLTVRDGAVRLSPHFYNSQDEADLFLNLLDNFLKSQSHK